MTAKTPQEDAEKPFMFGKQLVICKLCIRLLPARYCKRHTPKTSMTRTKMYPQEQVDRLIEAEATRRELALLDELDKSLPRKTERVTDFIEAKRQALKKGAE